MGRVPPSPCKVCGSANHWDKVEKQKRGILLVSSGSQEEESASRKSKDHYLHLQSSKCTTIVAMTKIIPNFSLAIAWAKTFRNVQHIAIFCKTGSQHNDTSEQYKVAQRATAREGHKQPIDVAVRRGDRVNCTKVETTKRHSPKRCNSNKWRLKRKGEWTAWMAVNLETIKHGRHLRNGSLLALDGNPNGKPPDLRT
ncbi:hypothetical protein C8R45DRAFT_931014 [Mycena sanguinolenta]|nr:hypothetical protein C8R45DRAFT_931014 [Mycena sanguinolenta]